jgi:hypothetical protein
MLKNTVAPFLVTEEQRRENSLAKKRRDAWRRRYAAVSQAIRNTKKDRHLGEFTNDYQLQVQLDALREHARELMWYRSHLGEALRNTSYQYVPKEMLPTHVGSAS